MSVLKNSKSKRQIGEELLIQNRSDEYKNIVENLAKTAPELADFLLEFVYGSVWSRSYEDNPIILPKIRAITTISCLASLGKEPQLKSHIGGALKIGVSKEEIIEVLLHLCVYAGFPVAINAIKIAQEVFTEMTVE